MKCYEHSVLSNSLDSNSNSHNLDLKLLDSNYVNLTTTLPHWVYNTILLSCMDTKKISGATWQTC